jgi:hypothetical protein
MLRGEARMNALLRLLEYEESLAASVRGIPLRSFKGIRVRWSPV